jgi:cytoskeletal protein CcmA (bactofilin family)
MFRRTNQEDTPSEHLNDGTPPALLTVVGSDAKLEGTFDIADSVQIECEVGGQLKVGNRLVIGERGCVRADVETVDAIINGQYKGNMVATGSVEITPTGRVAGKIETDSLVISKGGFFNGKTVKLKESQADDGLSPGDRPKRETLRAARNQRTGPALREAAMLLAAEDHGLSPDGDEMAARGQEIGGGDAESGEPLASPPKRRKARAAPRKGRREKTKLKEAQAEGGPVPDFMIEDAGDPFLPSPSQDELLPEDLGLYEGPPPEDRPKQGGRRAGRSQRKGPALREADGGHTMEDHGFSPDGSGADRSGRANDEADAEPGEPLAGPPKHRRARAVPRKGRGKKTKTSHDHGPTAKLKEAQAEEGPVPAFVIEDAGEPLPPLPSRTDLLPEDLDLDEGPPPGDRGRAVPRKERREQTKTSIDDRITARLKESQAVGGPAPPFLVEGMGEPLPPLPSRGELLPENLDLDEGPHPEDQPGLEGLGIGRNQRSGSGLRGNDDSGEDIGKSRAGWARQPAPFPDDDDPLGIR